jgi:hypothetical protein
MNIDLARLPTNLLAAAVTTVVVVAVGVAFLLLSDQSPKIRPQISDIETPQTTVAPEQEAEKVPSIAEEPTDFVPVQQVKVPPVGEVSPDIIPAQQAPVPALSPKATSVAEVIPPLGRSEPLEAEEEKFKPSLVPELVPGVPPVNEYRPILSDNVAAPQDESADLRAGNLVYRDTDAIFVSVPDALEGLHCIRTTFEDRIRSMNMSFVLSRSAFVYVLHDQRISRKPKWLRSFTFMGERVLVKGAVVGDAVFDVFVQGRPAGKVVLGSNIEKFSEAGVPHGRVAKDPGMYVVCVATN